MRTYTNSENMEVELGESHLQAAVDLKLELQKESFGGKCNWTRHRKMMKASGFNDSDINESYRCTVKRYQKETKQLSSVAKYADFVSDNKLKAIKDIVGELKYTKLETREENLIKSRFDRELTYRVMAVEELRDLALDYMDITVPHYVYQPRLKDNGNILKVILGDWHIGAKVRCLNNTFNLEVAELRVKKFINEIIDFGKILGVSTVSISLIGDLIEQLNLRYTQSDDCEFNTARQIIEAERLIFKIVIALSEHFNVEINAVAGNHDRLSGDKKESYEGDHAVYIIMEHLKDMLDMVNSDRIKITLSDNDYSYISETINGMNVKIIHGEDDNINDSNKLQKHSGIDEIDYDIIILGHLHHFDVRQDNKNKQVIYCSSLQGSNIYSREKIKSTSNAGQTLILFRADGQVYPINVDLQNV